jgi:hypothetical protein
VARQRPEVTHRGPEEGTLLTRRQGACGARVAQLCFPVVDPEWISLCDAMAETAGSPCGNDGFEGPAQGRWPCAKLTFSAP